MFCVCYLIVKLLPKPNMMRKRHPLLFVMVIVTGLLLVLKLYVRFSNGDISSDLFNNLKSIVAPLLIFIGAVLAYNNRSISEI